LDLIYLKYIEVWEGCRLGVLYRTRLFCGGYWGDFGSKFFKGVTLGTALLKRAFAFFYI